MRISPRKLYKCIVTHVRPDSDNKSQKKSILNFIDCYLLDCRYRNDCGFRLSFRDLKIISSERNRLDYRSEVIKLVITHLSDKIMARDKRHIRR